MQAAEIEDAYLCATPFGAVWARFPEDSNGVTLEGGPDAVAFVTREVEASTDIDGISLTLDRLEPSDLMEFCCRPGGLMVAPPFTDPADA
jgi:hypothetical protein